MCYVWLDSLSTYSHSSLKAQAGLCGCKTTFRALKAYLRVEQPNQQRASYIIGVLRYSVVIRCSSMQSKILLNIPCI